MTVPYYGKRKPGSLTAASPGDTLYFQFGTYNDSGASIDPSSFTASMIEIYKNGTANTPRLTDSGYTVINDTGQVGLQRFSIQLYNTADDASFFAVGSWYMVSVDSLTVDSRPVRLWVGSFEIDGTPADTGMVA